MISDERIVIDGINQPIFEYVHKIPLLSWLLEVVRPHTNSKMSDLFVGKTQSDPSTNTHVAGDSTFTAVWRKMLKNEA